MSETVTSVNPNPNLSTDDQFRSGGDEGQQPVEQQPVQQQPQPVEQQPDPKLETKPDESLESVSYDDFNKLKDAFVPKEEPKPVVPQAKPEGTTVAKSVEGSQPTQVTKSDGTKAVARDYTGFEETEIPLLKRMSNDAFAWLKPQLLERKNLAKVIADKDRELANLKSGKAQLPDSYFEHPQGFVLAPDYNSAASDLQRAAYVERHWQNQLVKIRQAGEWQDLNFDARGNVVLSQPQKATAEAEANVLGYINWASGQKQDKQRNLLTIEQGFRNRHSEALNVIKKIENDSFSAYNDEKHPYMPVLKNILNSIPPEFRNSPLASITAKAGTAVIQLLNTIKEKDLAIANFQKEVEELKKNGAKPKPGQQPTDGDITASSVAKAGAGGNETVTYDDFKALKN